MKLVDVQSIKKAQHDILFSYRGDEILTHFSFPIKTQDGDTHIVAVEDNLNAGEIVNVFDNVEAYLEDLKDAEIVDEGGEDEKTIRERWERS